MDDEAVYEFAGDDEDGRIPIVAGKPVIWVAEVVYEDHDFGLSKWQRRGFKVMLENGLTVSTIWGAYTYSTNHWTSWTADIDERPTTAEMAATWGERLVGWVMNGGEDQVLSYVPATMWWHLIRYLGRVPTGTDPIPSPDWSDDAG